MPQPYLRLYNYCGWRRFHHHHAFGERTLRELCYRTVSAFGDWWYWIGWGLFIALIVELYTMAAINAPAAFVFTGVLWLAWWALDVVNQEVKAWQIAVGIVMLGFGLLPRGIVLPVACWVIYCFQVRE